MEIEYIKTKYSHHHETFDIYARNSFITGSVITSMMKCCYEFNQYATRDYKINYGLVVKEYL